MGRQKGYVGKSDLIQFHRKRLGLTQEQLAVNAEISTGVVGKAEKGEPVELESLDLIARQLGLTLADVVAEPAGILPGFGVDRGKFEIPPEVVDKIASDVDLVAAIERMAGAAIKLPAGFKLTLLASREGCMEIDIAGTPEHLALLEEAYRAGAFESLGVIKFGRVYTPPGAESPRQGDAFEMIVTALADGRLEELRATASSAEGQESGAASQESHGRRLLTPRIVELVRENAYAWLAQQRVRSDSRDDIVQDMVASFLEKESAIPDLPPGEIDRWIGEASRAEAERAYIRSRKGRSALISTQVVPRKLAGGGEPSEVAEAGELPGQAELFLSRLPAATASVLRMRIAGSGYAEISKVLGMRFGEVLTRADSGLRELDRMMGRQKPD